MFNNFDCFIFHTHAPRPTSVAHPDISPTYSCMRPTCMHGPPPTRMPLAPQVRRIPPPYGCKPPTRMHVHPPTWLLAYHMQAHFSTHTHAPLSGKWETLILVSDKLFHQLMWRECWSTSMTLATDFKTFREMEVACCIASCTTLACYHLHLQIVYHIFP